MQHCSSIGRQCTEMTSFVCRMMKGSNALTNFSNPNTQRKTWEHFVSMVQMRTDFFVVEPRDSRWDIELDLRRAPLIISESGRNAKPKSVVTLREKLQDKLVFGWWEEPYSEK